MTKQEKIDKAWHNNFTVSNSRVQRCGNMICDKCQRKITGNYLIQDRTNYMLRGNEHDERYLFHRECSEDNVKWAEFDTNKKEEKQAYKIRNKQIKAVKDLIKKYNLQDVFECNS